MNFDLDENPLEPALYEILCAGEKVKEYDLIQILSQAPYHFFETQALSSALTLFQTHFILFNALYRLNDSGYQSETFRLIIEPLGIQLLHNKANPDSALETFVDPGLANYYLDWSNFEGTSKSDVEDLLDSFWSTFKKRSRVNEEKLNASLKNFNYQTLPTRSQLKKDYRKLCLFHHPDKGGERAVFQSLYQDYQNIKNALD